MPERPDVSVVLPTRDRADVLPRTLGTLATQRLDRVRAELVVVDNGSTPATLDVLEKLVAAHPWPARLVHEGRPGVAAARNAGLEAAQADLILFTNDDVIPAADTWLAGHVQAHKSGQDRVGIMGPVVWHPRLHSTSIMRWLASGGHSHRYEAVRAGRVEPAEMYANNLSVHRRPLEEVGGFDVRFTSYGWQEYDLSLRLHDRGFRVRFVEELEAWHDHEHDLRDSLRRMERIGRAAELFNEIHTGREGLLASRPRAWEMAVGAAIAPVARRMHVPERMPLALAGPLYSLAHKSSMAVGYRAARRERAA